MKTLRMMSVLAALFMLLPVFVSCDSEEDDPQGGEQVSDVSKIIGTYTGSLGYSVMGFEPGNIEGSYELKVIKDSENDGKVTVVLPACSFTPPIPQSGSFTIPSLTINDVAVTVKNDVYSIASQNDLTIEFEGVTYTGKLSGKIDGNAANVKYTLTPGRMPMDINFTFKGTK